MKWNGPAVTRDWKQVATLYKNHVRPFGKTGVKNIKNRRPVQSPLSR
jgi:hypothetical protein